MINRKVGSVLFVGLSLIILVGCRTSALMEIRDAAIPAAVGHNLTMDQVAKGIVAAGSKHGWAMKTESPGHIVGTLLIRSHMAVVDIPYTASSYSIIYKDSSNLSYDAGSKKIHANYSSWVRNLHVSIQREFGGAGKPN
ncbi:MAG: hypothetical protein HP490_11355 [Nitrospira sp.]|nr:hypothetical protein [Nitrospira sp.]